GGKANPHARNYGTFARIRALYVRELNIITLEDAVRKMSSLPAQRRGLTDRGLIRPGMKADITVFDPGRVRDAATFEKPHQYAEGVSTVIVNGRIVLDGGSMLPARPGSVLYHGSCEGAQTDLRNGWTRSTSTNLIDNMSKAIVQP